MESLKKRIAIEKRHCHNWNGDYGIHSRSPKATIMIDPLSNVDDGDPLAMFLVVTVDNGKVC